MRLAYLFSYTDVTFYSVLEMMVSFLCLHWILMALCLVFYEVQSKYDVLVIFNWLIFLLQNLS